MRISVPSSFLTVLGVMSVMKEGQSLEWTLTQNQNCGWDNTGSGPGSGPLCPDVNAPIGPQGEFMMNTGIFGLTVESCKEACEAKAFCTGFVFIKNNIPSMGLGRNQCRFRKDVNCYRYEESNHDCYALDSRAGAYIEPTSPPESTSGTGSSGSGGTGSSGSGGTGAPPSALATGDPHFETWLGRKYDFHGVCDLVLLQNPEFQEGLGLDIHVRTKKLKQFSYISAAALRIGNESLEVMGNIHQNLYWINKQQSKNTDEGIVGEINGYDIKYKKVNSKQHEFIINLGSTSITMKTYKNFVRVGINNATESVFGSSSGLFGAYGTGALISRDGNRIFEDTDEFGQEWQVQSGEDILFHNVEGPQAPRKCEIPSTSNIRRRLVESDMSEEDAKLSCAHVNPDVFEMCVFDVMATGDDEVVGAY